MTATGAPLGGAFDLLAGGDTVQDLGEAPRCFGGCHAGRIPHVYQINQTAMQSGPSRSLAPRAIELPII